MSAWKGSRHRWSAGWALVGLFLAAAARPAPASPATRLDQAVVSVFVSTMLSNGRGTGFCVGDGSWVVTCYHVVTLHVGEGKDLPVEHVLVLSPWSGEAVKATVAATDPKADLALLKLERGRWPALPVAGAEQFQPEKLTGDQPLFTIAGYGQTSSQLESDPEIHTSTTHAELLAAAQKAERQVLLFAPTTGAGPGWSGGPVVNDQGLVVGVFRALVAQPQMKEIWYPLATGVEPLRGLLQAQKIALTPSPEPLPKRSPQAGALFQRQFRALVWALGRRWDRAEAERRAELLLTPKDPLAHMGLALALLWEGRSDDALQETETAITLDPGRASAVFQKGLVLQRMSRLKDAETCMRRALEMEPNEAERHITFGALLAAEGQTTEAISMLRRAVELSPDHPLAHWRLGIALEAEEKWDAAVAELRRAAALGEPLEPLRVLRVDLAEALQKAGKPDEAEQEWRALAGAGDDPALEYRLAAFLAERRKSPEALQAIQKCLSLLEQHAPTEGTPDADLLKRATELKTRLEASG